MAEIAHHHTEAGDPANITNPEHSSHHIVTPRVYAMVFGTLLVFTGVTVVAAFIGLGLGESGCGAVYRLLQSRYCHPLLYAREVSVAPDQDDDRLRLLHLSRIDRYDFERLHQPLMGSLVKPDRIERYEILRSVASARSVFLCAAQDLPQKSHPGDRFLLTLAKLHRELSHDMLAGVCGESS